MSEPTSGSSWMKKAAKLAKYIGIGLMLVGVIAFFVANNGFYIAVYMFMFGIPFLLVSVLLNKLAGSKATLKGTEISGGVEEVKKDEKK